MENEADRDIRNAILLLLQACKMYQIRAASLNGTLKAIMELPPAKRSSLTLADFHADIAMLMEQVKLHVDKESEQLVKALRDSSDFLWPLRTYASQQFWTE